MPNQRGRKGTASVAVSPISTERRPGPPKHLNEEQAEVWCSVVDSLPADWFGRESFGLLEAYCGHLVTTRKLNQLIDNTTELSRLDKLFKMRERETRSLSALATRMRLSQQSTIDRERKKPAPKARTPW